MRIVLGFSLSIPLYDIVCAGNIVLRNQICLFIRSQSPHSQELRELLLDVDSENRGMISFAEFAQWCVFRFPFSVFFFRCMLMA